MEVFQTSNHRLFELFSERHLTAGREGLVIHTSDYPCVWTGQLPTLDISACREMGLPIGRGRYLGGSIVNFSGDLSLCEIKIGPSDFGPRVVARVSEWLEQQGVETVTNGNDVLAEGKKVISWAGVMTDNGCQQSVVHFSINTDVETIRRICTKPMVKEPGQLSDYEITADDILQVIYDLVDCEEYDGDL